MVFGILKTLIKHKDENVQQFIRELTPEPTSLFTDEYMRKQNKSILCNHILEVSTNESTSPAAGTCVALGGDLLHNMPWALPCTYSDILDQCLQYTLKNYDYCGRIVIVFDGYEDESSTKYQEHFNRSSKGVMAPDVHIEFVIFKPLSYCFKETVGFDAKASFGNCPLLRLIRWCNKPGDITKEFWEKAIHFHGIFHGLKITNCIYVSMEVAS